MPNSSELAVDKVTLGILNKYNFKPFLCRTSGCFYSHQGYFGVEVRNASTYRLAWYLAEYEHEMPSRVVQPGVGMRTAAGSSSAFDFVSHLCFMCEA